MAAEPVTCGLCDKQFKTGQKWSWCASGCLSAAHTECVSGSSLVEGKFGCPCCRDRHGEMALSRRLTAAELETQNSDLRELVEA